MQKIAKQEEKKQNSNRKVKFDEFDEFRPKFCCLGHYKNHLIR